MNNLLRLSPFLLNYKLLYQINQSKYLKSGHFHWSEICKEMLK